MFRNLSVISSFQIVCKSASKSVYICVYIVYIYVCMYMYGEKERECVYSKSINHVFTILFLHICIYTDIKTYIYT